MRVIQKIRMDLCGCAIPPIINAMQNDGNTRIVEVSLYSRGVAWLPPEGVTVSVHYQKPDGTAGVYDTLPDGTPACTITDNVVGATLAPQMTTVPGKVVASLVFLDGLGKQLATFPFYVQVAADPAAEVTESGDYFNFHIFLPQPTNAAAVGQYLEIEEVTEDGRVLKVRAVDNAGGSGASITVDDALSETSENPVQNKVITVQMNTAIGILQSQVLPKLLPSVTTDDNGKVLSVTDGVWVVKEITGGSGGSITVDSALSPDSTNPVQNKVIHAQLLQANAVLGQLQASIPTDAHINGLIDTYLSEALGGDY